MGPFTSNGTNRQEDIHACNIARSAIEHSLALEAHHTALLVATLITAVLSNRAPLRPINDLWKQIQVIHRYEQLSVVPMLMLLTTTSFPVGLRVGVHMWLLLRNPD